VESSGAPETSAAAAELAISRGMHVVMVSKETDSVVGPVLCRKAKEKGLVYTTGDGDQPSLLIGLISWGRVLGLRIVGAGKASEYDVVYDPAAKMIHCVGQDQSFACAGMDAQWLLADRPVHEVADARAALLGSLSMRSVPDMCEMTVVANATGMKPDRPTFHAPAARMVEMPDLFCPKADGGLFDQPGRLDIFTCLRRPDEISMAGGEFIIVECKDAKTWTMLGAKGHPVSRNGKYAALYIPQHLLGVETGTSVLAAAGMGHATGGDNVRPVCDLHGRAVRDLKKGHSLAMGGHHHTIEGVDACISDATPLAGESPLPFYLFSNLVLARDVPAGKSICLNDVEIPATSTLLRLRKEQDKAFGL
jgi:predicted homoserine dehydrogenase-like protein